MHVNIHFNGVIKCWYSLCKKECLRTRAARQTPKNEGAGLKALNPWPRLYSRAKPAPQTTTLSRAEVNPALLLTREIKGCFKECEAPAAPSETSTQCIHFSGGNQQFTEARSFPGSKWRTFSKDDTWRETQSASQHGYPHSLM